MTVLIRWLPLVVIAAALAGIWLGAAIFAVIAG
jgi:hypothetical protein